MCDYVIVLFFVLILVLFVEICRYLLFARRISLFARSLISLLGFFFLLVAIFFLCTFAVRFAPWVYAWKHLCCVLGLLLDVFISVSLCVLRCAQVANASLPGQATGVWSVKTSHNDSFDKYLVVSFGNATLVLGIGETVEALQDTGFFEKGQTLAVALLEEDALLQVSLSP